MVLTFLDITIVPQDLLDAGLGDFSSTESSEKGGGNVTHFKSV